MDFTHTLPPLSSETGMDIFDEISRKLAKKTVGLIEFGDMEQVEKAVEILLRMEGAGSPITPINNPARELDPFEQTERVDKLVDRVLLQNGMTPQTDKKFFDRRWIGVVEVAKLLDKEPRTIRNWCASEKVVCFKDDSDNWMVCPRSAALFDMNVGDPRLKN